MKKQKTPTITPLETLYALRDSIANQITHLEAPAKDKEAERESFLDAIMAFKEIFLTYGYHLRKHKGINSFRASILSTNRNLNSVLDRMGYSKEEIAKASPQNPVDS